MNLGITAAKEFHLNPGISLSEKQVTRLTSDIVWLVSQNITLPNGKIETVLVPKVSIYVCKGGDLNGSGALISASEVDIQSGLFNNKRGTIADREAVVINAETINNLKVELAVI